jgi:hypothetical protein
VSDDRAGARTRVRALIDAASRIADPAGTLGRRARDELPGATGLSPAGVELALTECLETHVTDADLAVFCAAVTPARAAHVLLSANVFVAAHRAIALALAASARVSVRPSRRDPAFARLLAEASAGLFHIVPELAPSPGDTVFAFGTDKTLATVRSTLPPTVTFHSHGSGIGVAILDPAHATRETARALALDVVPFDQRGCLSPRAALFLGPDSEARAFAALVASELEALAKTIPLGGITPAESADITLFRDTLTYSGTLFPAGPSFVATAPRNEIVFAPIGRNLTITPCEDPALLLRPHASIIAALGLATSVANSALLQATFPGARTSPLGRMQRPSFDGPVDKRSTHRV